MAPVNGFPDEMFMNSTLGPRRATWYFDVISPFAYLHLQRFSELPADLAIRQFPAGA